MKEFKKFRKEQDKILEKVKKKYLKYTIICLPDKNK
jgi:hypothetical protein